MIVKNHFIINIPHQKPHQYSLFLEEIRWLHLDLKIFDSSKTNLDDFYLRQLGININRYKQFVFVLRITFIPSRGQAAVERGI